MNKNIYNLVFKEMDDKCWDNIENFIYGIVADNSMDFSEFISRILEAIDE